MFEQYDNSPRQFIFIGWCDKLRQASSTGGVLIISFSKIINTALTFESMRSTLTFLKNSHLLLQVLRSHPSNPTFFDYYKGSEKIYIWGERLCDFAEHHANFS
jgi:hypothetical protein